MKTILQSILFIALFSLSAKAQWVEQTVQFSAFQMWCDDISVVDQNTVWVHASDNQSGTLDLEFSRTTDGGQTWEIGIITGGFSTSIKFSRIFAVDANTAWIVSNGDKTGGQMIFKTTDAGATWTAQSSAEFLGSSAFASFVYFWDANNGVAIGDPNGGYYEHYTTSDGGDNWVRVLDDSLILPKPLDSEWGILGSKNHTVIGDNLWYGTNKGRVMRTNDRGLTWAIDSTGLSNVSKVAFMDDMNGIAHGSAKDTAGNSVGRHVLTTDGGVTWSAPINNYRITSDTLNDSTNVWPTDIKAIPNAGVYLAVFDGWGNTYSNDGLVWHILDTTHYLGSDNIGVAPGTNTVYVGGPFYREADTVNHTGEGGIYKTDDILASIAAVGVEETEIVLPNPSVGIYPNPSTGIINISLNNFSNTEEVRVNVYNILGERVLSSTDRFVRKSFNLSNYGTGLYLVEVLSNGIAITKKVMVK